MDKVLLLIVLAVILIAAMPLVFSMNPFTSAIARVKTYDDIIRAACARFGVPEKRIRAMIIVESNGYRDVTGSAGERGFLQMMQGALADVNARFGLGFSWADMYDGEKNIYAGTAYLAITTRFFGGDLDKGTRAYNAGMGAVSRSQTAGAAYLQKVLDVERWMA